MKWITLEHPNIVGLASAWLITRFIDHEAQIIFSSEANLDLLLKETNAIPFEIPGVEFSTGDTQTSFSILLTSYRFTNAILTQINKLITPTNLDPLQKYFEEHNANDKWQALVAIHDTDELALSHGIDALDQLYKIIKGEHETLAETLS